MEAFRVPSLEPRHPSAATKSHEYPDDESDIGSSLDLNESQQESQSETENRRGQTGGGNA